MKKLLYLFLTFALVVSCSKSKVGEEVNDTQSDIKTSGKLISASKLKTQSLLESAEESIAKQESMAGGYIDYSEIDLPKMMADFIKLIYPDLDVDIAALLKSNQLQVVTYRILYTSTTRDKNGYKPAEMSGDVSYMVDKSGLLGSRTLESVSLFHTCYCSSAADVAALEPLIIPFRTMYNALGVFPLYQGGTAYDQNPILTNDFKLKAIQAIDCELAALEFIKDLENVDMASNYYTENIGISNGGGPALAFQYLLENDPTYSKYADDINLRSTFVGEGNCKGSAVFPNVTKLFSDEEENSSSMNMNGLTPSAYVTMVASSYLTWEDKYFKGIDLEDYFSKGFLNSRDIYGMNRLQKFQENDGYYSLMEDGLYNLYPGLFTDDFKISPATNIINPDLLDYDEETGTYSIKEDGIISNLYQAFAENEDILSGWAPQAKLMIAHSEKDDFIPYETNYKIYTDLHRENPSKVYLTKAYFLNHLYASFYFMLNNVCLKKHPCS